MNYTTFAPPQNEDLSFFNRSTPINRQANAQSRTSFFGVQRKTVSCAGEKYFEYTQKISAQITAIFMHKTFKLW